MLLAPHILVGAAIASKFQNPLLGILFAFLSHFILDAIPHWEYPAEPLKQIRTKGVRYLLPIFRRVALDLLLGFTVLAAAVYLGTRDIPMTAWALGGFFGILPDGFSFLLFLKPKNRLLSTFLKIIWAIHHRIHYDKEKRGMPPLRIGLSTQIIAVLLALYFLIF